jgi:hypothetical protein
VLARLTDRDGDEVWINPIHVRSVMVGTGLFGGPKGTRVMLGGEESSGHRVFVRESPAVAAARLNAAMPLVVPADLSVLDDRRTPEDPPPTHTPHAGD